LSNLKFEREKKEKQEAAHRKKGEYYMPQKDISSLGEG